MLPKYRILSATCVLAIALMGSGCSGLNYTHGVAPIDFLIPGGHMQRFLMNEQPLSPETVAAGNWRADAGTDSTAFTQ